MRSKQAAGNKKPSIVVKDLKTKKNPKGGAVDMFLKLSDSKGSSRKTTVIDGIFKF